GVAIAGQSDEAGRRRRRSRRAIACGIANKELDIAGDSKQCRYAGKNVPARIAPTKAPRGRIGGGHMQSAPLPPRSTRADRQGEGTYRLRRFAEQNIFAHRGGDVRPKRRRSPIVERGRRPGSALDHRTADEPTVSRPSRATDPYLGGTHIRYFASHQS